jgi:hypothetical protein
MTSFNGLYLSNYLTYVYEPEIGERTKFTTINGTAILNTANSNLDGTGTIASIITSSSPNGTLIKSVTMKGEKSVTRGMIRFYVESDDATPLIDIVTEIEIPARETTSIQESYALSLEIDFVLQNGYKLSASIENGSEDMVITAEGVNISYP